MKKTTAISCWLAITVVGGARAQEGDKKPEAPKAGGVDPAAMAEYLQSVQPGLQHEVFKKQVGIWDMEQTMFMPGVPPLKSTGTTTNRIVFGGRYLISEVEDATGSGSYQGMGISAYDNATKRYVYVWIDSMRTGVMVSYGKVKDDGSIEYTSEPQPDPTSGQELVFRIVTKMEGDNKMTMEMFSKSSKGDDAGDAKGMSIVYAKRE